MRILAVNHEYTMSGAARLMFVLAGHLRRAGHTVAVSAADPAPGPIRDAYRDAGFEVLDPPFSGWFDFAVCNTIATAPIVTTLPGTLRTLWWLHEGASGLDLLLRHPEWSQAFARANAIVFVNRWQRDAVFRSFVYRRDPAHTVVVPNGISVPASPPPRTDGTICVVSIGAVYPAKRQFDLIRAVAALRSAPLRCVLVGRIHDLPPDCRALAAAEPDRFRLAGELGHAEAMAELGRADIFCLPSESEAMPLTVLEAAMLEKPMVLADLPVYADTWRHGRNCLLYPVGEVDLLAPALAWLAGDPALRRRLGTAARHTAAPYTEAAMLARFDAILAGL